MLTFMRRILSTWVAKLLFVLLILSFGMWGIGDVVTGLQRGDMAVAHVAGDSIGMPEMNQALRNARIDMQRRMQGVEITPQIQHMMAGQLLERMITERSIAAEIRRMHIQVPDNALRNEAFANPAFHDASGRFSPDIFAARLRNANMTEAMYTASVRSELAWRQIRVPMISGINSPDALTLPLYAQLAERRAAMTVLLPFASVPEPALPDEAALRRFQENNPDKFSAPEYRQISLAVMSPAILAGEVEVSDADIAATYEAHRAQYVMPETRTVSILTVQDEAKARELAAAWRTSTDAAAFEKTVQEAGGALSSLTAAQAQFPIPDLARAAFATAKDQVTDPVQSPLGWHVLRVTDIMPATTRTLDQVKDEIRRLLALERATDLVFSRANKVEDSVGGGASVAETARDNGIAFVTATVDRSGADPQGQQVDLRVSPEARTALLTEIFQARVGDAPQTHELAGNTFIALSVDASTPSALRPYEQVAEAVKTAWIADARRRAQEERASAMMTAAKAGTPLATLAHDAQAELRPIEPVGRAGGAAVMPQLVQPLFELKLNDATMVETPTGFIVMQLTAIVPANPAENALQVGQLRDQLSTSLAQDIEAQFVAALRTRADVRINEANFNRAIQE